MQASFSLQSELRDAFRVPLYLAILLPSVHPIVVRV